MLFENFFEDSRGNTRSAGTMDLSVGEFCGGILKSPSFRDIDYLVWDSQKGELHIFYSDSCFIYALPTPEELIEFRKMIPQIPHY